MEIRKLTAAVAAVAIFGAAACAPRIDPELAVPADDIPLLSEAPPDPAPTQVPQAADPAAPAGLLGTVAPARSRATYAGLVSRSASSERYGVIEETAMRAVATTPLSTFSIDVDTASYANVRRFLRAGRLPPADAVRVEELVNYFDYGDPLPPPGEPFALTAEIGACPWAPHRELVRIGLRSAPIATDDLPPSNLVLLVDVSGSMQAPDKLPLLKRAFSLLVAQMGPEDHVAIVVYAGAAGVALPPTSGSERAVIDEAIGRLEAGGATAGGAGILTAYALAREHYADGSNNRIMLATDGDFNVGVSSDGELVRLVEAERATGTYLSVLGFGTGNLQDERMERLAQAGNGSYGYIDTIAEARRQLVEQLGATLVTVAEDVRLQVEFNPAQVKAHRLIGYENRRLADEAFEAEDTDAGELGAGHVVTALYELIPADSDEPAPSVAPLRYQQPAPAVPGRADEVLRVRARYRLPGAAASGMASVTLDRPAASAEPSAGFRLASAVAELGLLLHDSEYRGDASYAGAAERAQQAAAGSADARLAELVDLIGLADAIRGR